MKNNTDFGPYRTIKRRVKQSMVLAPPLSEHDKHRLLRELMDANMRGDREARRRIEKEVLSRPVPRKEIDT